MSSLCLAQVEGRLRCPHCGSRDVQLIFTVPSNVQAAKRLSSSAHCSSSQSDYPSMIAALFPLRSRQPAVSKIDKLVSDLPVGSQPGKPDKFMRAAPAILVRRHSECSL
jgi:hypothetical protein